MKTKFSVLFYLKRQKMYEAGPVPIYMRITVEGKRVEISACRDVEPDKWNGHASRAIGTNENAKSLNAYLDSLQNKIKDAQYFLMETGIEVTAENLKNHFTGKAEKPRLLITIFREHNDDVKELLGNGYAENTLKGYRTTLVHLTKFLKHHYSSSDFEIKRLDHAFVTSFEFFMRTKLKLSAVTTVYSGETDHPIPWQTDHLIGWRMVVANAVEA